MTRYVTTEEQYECYYCGVSCARRELVNDAGCPNCKTDFMIFSNENGKLLSLRTVINYDEESVIYDTLCNN